MGAHRQFPGSIGGGTARGKGSRGFFHRREAQRARGAKIPPGHGPRFGTLALASCARGCKTPREASPGFGRKRLRKLRKLGRFLRWDAKSATGNPEGSKPGNRAGRHARPMCARAEARAESHQNGPRIVEAVRRYDRTASVALASWRAVLARSPGGLSHKPPGLGGFGGCEPSRRRRRAYRAVGEASRARCAFPRAKRG